MQSVCGRQFGNTAEIFPITNRLLFFWGKNRVQQDIIHSRGLVPWPSGGRLRSWAQAACTSSSIAFWRKWDTCPTLRAASNFTVFFANVRQMVFLPSDFCSANWVEHSYFRVVAVWACLCTAELVRGCKSLTKPVFLSLSIAQIWWTKWYHIAAYSKSQAVFFTQLWLCFSSAKL